MSGVNHIYGLFEVFGIEIEYMIVDKQSLNPLPIADKVLQKLNNGKLVNEVELGDIAVSNELALHVIELKTNGPVKDLNNLDKSFLKVLCLVQDVLNGYEAILLPTGMHPWFVPDSSLKLWPHSNKEIYNAYNRIFNCQGHGWGNLQSTHINLPFSNEKEFFILHESIRLLLPIIPALTASTPFVSGDSTDTACNRLLYYGKNQAKLPCISGQIIPESIKTYKQYQEQILQQMYEAIAPYDSEGILQHEWLNSRGAITRFERNAIEIRIVDSQESPLMDVVCIMLIVYGLKNLIAKKVSVDSINISTEELVSVYHSCIKLGSKAVIDNSKYLDFLGCNNEKGAVTAKDIWLYIYSMVKKFIPNEYHHTIEKKLSLGCLAQRLQDNYNKNHDLKQLYNKLHICMLENTIFYNE